MGNEGGQVRRGRDMEGNRKRTRWKMDEILEQVFFIC
jgi:hypothetical protein